MTFKETLLESLPASALTPRVRFLSNAERGLLLACEQRKAHGKHHEGKQ